MKKLALFVLIMGIVLVSNAVGQEFTDVTIGTADPGGTVVTDGVYEITGNGDDIWNAADAFQYYYTELTGDGSLVARVVSNGEGTNGWSKGSAMIRQDTTPGSVHASMALTGGEGNGYSFQWRPAADDVSLASNGVEPAIALPYWEKIERVGDVFTGYISADGIDWMQVGEPVTIEMADPVLIGLAVTSHAVGELRTFTFDNVSVESVLANSLAAWEEVAMAAGPTYMATNVEDGLYDIGTYDGEQTYEFIVQSNPDEEQASMALIGRRDFGDTQSGLKYEQWNNTGTYGATLFGVADYDFGVANNPGVITHLVFVASTEAGMTDLYVNGAYAGSVEAAITMSGLVGIGYGAQDRADADPFFDDFDGAIYGVAIYDRALSLAQIRVNADTYLQKGPSDITTPGDMVQGVPDDGDWPPAETPDLAIDNNVETKFLHFKGDFDPNAGPTGIEVTPVLGPTIVTGLTLTTANDVAGRDPIAFELYGSNDGVEGPYTLIASGDIVDFAGEAEWPRFTMNETPITFENETAYTSYQLVFTAIRGPVGGSVNSMQIAEVELIGVPVIPAAKPLVVWVSFHPADDEPGAGAAGAGFTEAADIGYTNLLKDAGYDVVRYVQTGTPDLDVVNGADLVIVSRSAASGSFQNDAATTWNGVTAPMIVMSGYTVRSSRMGYFTGTNIPDTTGDISLTAADPAHPIFAGVELDADGTMVNPFAGVVTYADGTLARGISLVTDALDDEAILVGTVSAASEGNGPVGAAVIAEIPAGATLVHDGGAGTDVLAGPRLLFLSGAREADGISSETAGLYDLYDDGATLFLNAVAYMIQ